MGPGPCVFSTAGVWVDATNALHLAIKKTAAGTWTCAEVIAPASYGYGTYAFRVSSPLNTFDPNVVLGLFTAIHRLRQVHARIAGALEEAGLLLLAQHVDQLDATSLVEIVRAEEDSCLLGTDAMRDGVDVAGRSLRLIVFDRVPWARPSILYRERRKHFVATRYDDLVARLRLKQAYGRLVRRADDRGVFVVLDSQLPSRLAGAFPEGVEIRRVGLAEAIQATRDLVGKGRGPLPARG